ncbi:MAG TPA: metal ABC transporter permease [Alphaproteobacteria bacterium]|nr:zinc ABC transporter permease [Rhodospirillaceae bacterium]HRJ11985.1 metal ABC transporter permease [Alphaproteobacteria bacterium]
MWDYFIQPFVEYGFMHRALAAAIILSISGAVIGTFLVLRRMSLIGDSMAHAVLPGAAVGFLYFGLSLPAMSLGGLVTGLILAVLAAFSSRLGVLREDASFAALFPIALALGVVLVLQSGTSLDLMHVLFGALLAVNDTGLIAIAAVASVTLLTFAVFYRFMILEALDPDFLLAQGHRPIIIQAAFLILTILNLVIGFEVFGTLMVLGLLIVPAVAAQLWARQIPTQIAGAALIGIISSATGLLLSYHANLPSGPAIILVAGGFYVISLCIGRFGSVRAQLQSRRHLQH